MISKSAEKYCCESVSKIENYTEAVSDKKVVWHCHHKLELCDGQELSKKTLLKHGLYYNRPAEELIFLRPGDHMLLHLGKTRRFDFSKVHTFNDFIHTKQKIQKKYAFWNMQHPENKQHNDKKMAFELSELFRAYEKNETECFKKEREARQYCKIVTKMITYVSTGKGKK